MPRKSTARLVAGFDHRVAQAEQENSAATQAVRDLQRQREKELSAAKKKADQTQRAVYETRRSAFEELLHHHGEEQCSLCLGAASAAEMKLICAVHPQGSIGTSGAKMPNWQHASLMRICPTCMQERRRGFFPFLDKDPGVSTNSYHEMWRLWFPARRRGEVWEFYSKGQSKGRWRPLPKAAVESSFFTYSLQVKLVLTVAQRLGWGLESFMTVYEQSKTKREKYADELAKQRKERKQRKRAPRSMWLYGTRVA